MSDLSFMSDLQHYVVLSDPSVMSDLSFMSDQKCVCLVHVEERPVAPQVIEAVHDHAHDAASEGAARELTPPAHASLLLC